MPRDPGAKIFQRSELVTRFGRPREYRLVFTNGCFDLLHRGHVAYLAEARRLGDVLLVAVNTDRSVRNLKGAGRPVQPEADRAYILASLEAVDLVTLFDEDTPQALIAALLPDTLVKGGDYRPEEIVGSETVLAAGGQVRVLSFFGGRSTSGILAQLGADPR